MYNYVLLDLELRYYIYTYAHNYIQIYIHEYRIEIWIMQRGGGGKINIFRRGPAYS